MSFEIEDVNDLYDCAEGKEEVCVTMKREDEVLEEFRLNLKTKETNKLKLQQMWFDADVMVNDVYIGYCDDESIWRVIDVICETMNRY